MAVIKFKMGDIDCKVNPDNLKEAVCNSAGRILSGLGVIVIITRENINVLINQKYYAAEYITNVDYNSGEKL